MPFAAPTLRPHPAMARAVEGARQGLGGPEAEAQAPSVSPDAVPAEALPQPGPDAPPEAEARQAAAAPAPSQVTFNINRPIPVPPVGNSALRAMADVPGVTWSLHAGTAALDGGSSIAADGRITLGAGQAAGIIEARATSADGAWASNMLHLVAHPTGVGSTTLIGDPSAGSYGHVFDHVLTSSTGDVANLENVPVGENFPGLATPAAATHLIPNPPFPFDRSFTLHTATLTTDANNNWFLTAAGMLGGTHDTVSMEQAGIDVGRFTANASNPTAAGALPQGFTVDQHLHWYNPLAAANARWMDFVTVQHKRELKLIGTDLKFVTTVNNLEDGGDDYVGPVAPHALTATPASVAHSAGPPAGGGTLPPANTVALAASTVPATLPAGGALVWSFRGPALGSTLTPDTADPHRATLTVGTTAGSVTIRVADAAGNNFDQVMVTIT